MKILMLTDLEGVGGVYSFRQSRDAHGSAMNRAALRHQIDEVNAAVRGAFAAGATQALVTGLGGHGGPGDLGRVDERAELLLGGASSAVLRRMFEEIGFDAVFLLGFHAMANTQGGILSHTGSSKGIWGVTVNGRPMGEAMQNAIRYGVLGLPVVLVTGDDLVCGEVAEFLGDQPVYVTVKRGLGREVAWLPNPAEACERIEAGAREAMGRIADAKPYRPEFPLRIRTQALDAGILDLRRGPTNRLDAVTTERVVDKPEDMWG